MISFVVRWSHDTNRTPTAQQTDLPVLHVRVHHHSGSGPPPDRNGSISDVRRHRITRSTPRAGPSPPATPQGSPTSPRRLHELPPPLSVPMPSQHPRRQADATPGLRHMLHLMAPPTTTNKGDQAMTRDTNHRMTCGTPATARRLVLRSQRDRRLHAVSAISNTMREVADMQSQRVAPDLADHAGDRPQRPHPQRGPCEDDRHHRTVHARSGASTLPPRDAATTLALDRPCRACSIDQRVVEFQAGGIKAIDERDVCIHIAAALLDVPPRPDPVSVSDERHTTAPHPPSATRPGRDGPDVAGTGEPPARSWSSADHDPSAGARLVLRRRWRR